MLTYPQKMYKKAERSECLLPTYVKTMRVLAFFDHLDNSLPNIETAKLRGKEPQKHERQGDIKMTHQFTTIIVKIWGKVVGAANWNKDGRCAAFEFDKAFLSSGLDLAPVHMSIKKALISNHFEFPNIDRNTFHGLPGLLANSFPDNFGNSIINEWLRQQGRTPDTLNPIERLAFIGSRGMGALEFEPCSADPRTYKTVSIYVDKLRNLAQNSINSSNTIDVNVHGTPMCQDSLRLKNNINFFGRGANFSCSKNDIQKSLKKQ